MIQFGYCVPVEQSAIVKAAGFDFVETTVHDLLKGSVNDEQWDGPERAHASVLPVPAANSLVPGSLKITGPQPDLAKLQKHLERVVRRASAVGMKILVFGSGAARNVPEGFDRETARRQIVAFCHMAADICAGHEIMLVAEPLHRGECNIINSVEEAMGYVREVNNPHFQCLVDSFHLWLEHEPLENVRAAMPWIRHVHLADVAERVSPGESGRDDYRPLFSILKQGGYDGLITVEAFKITDLAAEAPRAMKFLKQQWSEA